MPQCIVSVVKKRETSSGRNNIKGSYEITTAKKQGAPISRGRPLQDLVREDLTVQADIMT